MTVRIILGDCREVLRTLPDASVHCCITSPPYWHMRDYGVDGQIGLEDSVQAWVDELVAVFREVRRVLRSATQLAARSLKRSRSLRITPRTSIFLRLRARA